jgi:hypothetical protein
MGSNLAAIQRLQKEIDFILEQEDIKWKQRAKQNWYQKGDHTHFFHAWMLGLTIGDESTELCELRMKRVRNGRNNMR